MTRFNLCLFVLLLSLLLTSCQTTRVDELPWSKQFAMVALHDLNPTAAVAAKGQCLQIEFNVKMEVGREDLEYGLRLDKGSASALLNFVQRKVDTLNAIVCNFSSPPGDKQLRSMIRRPIVHSAKGDWIMICTRVPSGGEDCTICVENENGKLECTDIHFPLSGARRTPKDQ